MPPQISDSESEGDVIPSGTKKIAPSNGDAATTDVDIPNEQEDDEGDEGEEEYVVEAIKDHRFEGEMLLLQVKWKGYEKKSDMTWEPEENCEGAKEVVEEYYKLIGGRPRKPSSKRGRQSTGTPASARATKKSRASMGAFVKNEGGTPAPEEDDWKPPKGSWEKEIAAIDTIEKADNGKLMVYVQWNNERKSQHEIETIYQKCPQRMLHFYEQNLVFKETTTL